MEQTALITGATSGIGRLAAELMADAGWQVWVAGRDLARAERAAAEIGANATPLQLDVTDAASIAAAAAQVNMLGALINNAGIQPDFRILLADASPEVFRQTYETNVFGVVAVTNALLPKLRRSRAPRIVNVSSGTGSLTWSDGPNPQFDHAAVAASGGHLAAYRSSKTALNALTLFYAQTLEPEGFKVNALAPGRRATHLNPRAIETGEDPTEAAQAIVDLAQLPDDGPTGKLLSWDGTVAPW